MNNQSFRKTRIVLTSWYVAILAVILFAFSFVLYTGEQHDFVRIIVQRDFISRIPHVLTPTEQDDVQNQLLAIRSAFLLNLLSVDGLILIIGGALSYLLAGITLSPIQKTFEKQKLFLADVSHEIRTPLAAIQTATEVSLRSKEKTKDDYKHVLTQVYDESKRLTKMANDLLLLSRMESGTPLVLKRISLTKIVEEVVDTMSSAASEKNITLTMKLQKAVFISGDDNLVKQALMIFIDNAIKFTKSGGTIAIMLDETTKPRIQITDTGIGIATEDQKRIFERFYQADSSRSSMGNGLGLAIAKEIILVHKAKVSVESAIDTGTTFTITFAAA